jgi:hypothetical protein
MSYTNSTRASVSEFAYVTKDGESHKQVNPGAKIVRVTFGNGYTDDVVIGDLSKEILACAVQQGLAIKLQRSFASAKGSVEDAIESFLTVKENLLSGTWASKREGSGPRLSILSEAIKAALEGDGQTVDDKRMADIVAKLADDDKREAAMANPKVKAHYESIRAARAAERAASAMKEAEGSSAALDF